MNFGEAISSGLSHYVKFSGRAPRSEFRFWYLFVFILSIVANIIDAAVGMPTIGLVVSLGLLLPGISMGIRRLHDLDRTGWWFLIAFTGVGAILLIIWACLKGTAGSNRYGPDPIAVS